MKSKWGDSKYLTWIVTIILIITIWVVVVAVLLDNHRENKATFLASELKRFEGEVQTTLETYGAFSHYIYDEISEDEAVISTMSRANNATEKEKNDLREWLYNHLNKKYNIMQNYEFRQLHFHLPDTESFLRVHAPEKYGDNLKNVRESVRLANETKEIVTGFEEGRIFNGYRYVYPLFDEDTHIGSVEVSISTASVIRVFSQLHPEEDFYFIINKSVVEEKVFDSEKDNYEVSFISDEYYMDKNVEKIVDAYSTIALHSDSGFWQGLKKEYEKNIKGDSFAAFYAYGGKDFVVRFLAINNFKAEPVAYLISLFETNEYKRLAKEINTQLILITSLAILTFIFGIIFLIYQFKLKKVSETDYLTKLYNRHKFYELVQKELKRAERYGFPSSFMMLDIDHFKNINDTYGHDIGDKVLKELSTLLSDNIRETDVLARWGGEEFLFFLPHIDKKEALKMAEKIRKLVDEKKNDEFREVTVSIGVAVINPGDYDLDKIINEADKALYQAKKSGRNRVCSSGKPDM